MRGAGTRPARGAGPPLVVLCPLREEAAALRARLDGRTAAGRIAGTAAWRGRLAGRPTVLCVTGDGPSAARAAEAATAGAAGVIIAGVGGGLSPDLRRARVVVASELYDDIGGGRAVPAHAEALARAAGAIAAPVVTAGAIVTGPAQRRALAEGWEPPPAVADLESWPMSAAAREAGVPWAVLRAVSDTAADTLPAFLEASRGPEGSLRRGRVAASALLRPWTLPALLRLAGAVAACSAALADACEALAALGWPDPDGIRESGRAGPRSVGFRG
jgi:nucleoside phosphorylase